MVITQSRTTMHGQRNIKLNFILFPKILNLQEMFEKHAQINTMYILKPASETR